MNASQFHQALIQWAQRNGFTHCDHHKSWERTPCDSRKAS